MTVTDILEGGGNLFVSFSSVVGRGVGAWKSGEYPRHNLGYDVELDIDSAVEDAAYISRETECKIEIEDGAVILTGCIESVEDDGMAFLCLAQDCLIMVEFSSAIFKPGDWITIKVDPADLGLHVIGAYQSILVHARESSSAFADHTSNAVSRSRFVISERSFTELGLMRISRNNSRFQAV